MLAGGAGTRFWPASRRARPKPFVRLLGPETLIEITVSRLRMLAPAERISVVSSSDLGPLLRATLAAEPEVRLLLEPAARNTAAAIAWAAARALGEGTDGVLGIFPADHHIPKPAEFARTVRTAARAAADGEKLVLVGIQPSRPDPAYGYLRLGDGRGARPVERFVEKPRKALARRYVQSGRYLWNGGMLLARPERILDETRTCAPEVWSVAGSVLERIAAGRRVKRTDFEDVYRKLTPISFDYAVLERSDRVFAVRGRFPWSDIGSWDALSEHLPREGANRARKGEGGAPIALDAANNVVWNATDKAMVLMGVNNLIVVETADAVLICSKERAQDIRWVVDELNRRGRRDLT